MGVCVDDTLHYATWFRRGLRMGLNRHQATRFAYENAAKAMYQSSFVVAFGLAAFGVSAFMPTRRFGLLMLTLLNFGLLADLVLTPAMMAGPLGYFFSKWWIKPKELEVPTAPLAETADRPASDAASPIPAPHMPALQRTEHPAAVGSIAPPRSGGFVRRQTGRRAIERTRCCWRTQSASENRWTSNRTRNSAVCAGSRATILQDRPQLAGRHWQTRLPVPRPGTDRYNVLVRLWQIFD